MGRAKTTPLAAIERQVESLEAEQVALKERQAAIRRELRQLNKARAVLEADDGEDET